MIDIGILLLRIAVGVTMFMHGLVKFQRRAYFEHKWSHEYGFHKSFDTRRTLFSYPTKPDVLISTLHFSFPKCGMV